MEHETINDIVSKLSEEGLTVKQIQECYERYVWHVDYYEPKLKEVEKELSMYKLRFGELDKRNDRIDKEMLSLIRKEDSEMRCSYIIDNIFKSIGLNRFDTESATDIQLEKLERILADIEQVIDGTLSSYDVLEE